jgi:aspartyl aminopeptidase
MNRKANDGYTFNNQVDLLPLFADGSQEGALLQLISAELKVDVSDILGSDLYLYSRQQPSIWGCHDEFLSCGRLDDQQCAFASLKGLLGGSSPRSVNVLACFDNEEVGSGTKQGAASTFLYDVLKRITLGLGMDETDYLRALASSFMLSADNAHAVHPNHPEHTDDTNCTYMNEGVVVKSHAGQRYTSDGMSIAVIKELSRRAAVPLQFFANRSDKAGGSTLGNIAMSQVSLNCVDIGLPQLAMHSCYETAGIKDTWYMIRLMTEFYSSHFEESDSQVLQILK